MGTYIHVSGSKRRGEPVPEPGRKRLPHMIIMRREFEYLAKYLKNAEIIKIFRDKGLVPEGRSNAHLSSFLSCERKRLGIPSPTGKKKVRDLLDRGFTVKEIIRHTKVDLDTIYKVGVQWRKENAS